MKAKDKSEELIEKFGIEKAILCVDEILKGIAFKDCDERFAFELCGNQFYWNEVKQEILNRQ